MIDSSVAPNLLPILWQNTVVDVIPTSRYGDPATVPDTAIVSTTVGYETSDGIRTQNYLNTLPVFADEEGAYHVPMPAPIAHTELIKDADISVVVFVPRIAPRDPILNRFSVRMTRWFEEGVDTVFGHEDSRAIAARTGVAWYWVQDPNGIVEYVYENVPGR